MTGLTRRISRLLALGVVSAAILGWSSEARADLVINGVFTGGARRQVWSAAAICRISSPAAATYWERAFSAPGDNWAVTVQYGWSPLMGINGEHILLTQGGTPNREISGQIYLDNSGNTPFFADPTH